MHEYKVTVRNNKILEFKSSHLISNMMEVDFGGVPFVVFEDAKMAINLMNVKEMDIDGTTYKLKPYAVR